MKEHKQIDSILLNIKMIPIIKVVILTLVSLGFYSTLLYFDKFKKLKNILREEVIPFWILLFSGISFVWLIPVFSGLISVRLSLSGIADMLLKSFGILYLLVVASINAYVQYKNNVCYKQYCQNVQEEKWKNKDTFFAISCVFIFIIFFILCNMLSYSISQ